MDEPLNSELDFISYLAQGYLIGCVRAVILATENDAHMGWNTCQVPIPVEKHSLLARRTRVISSTLQSMQEWQVAQMEQKAKRLTCFLTGRADPHTMPGFLHPWIRYSLTMREPPLFVLNGLLTRAADMVRAIHEAFFENADFSTVETLRLQIAGLVRSTPWVPIPVEVDESDCWVSLAEFAKSHPVWSEKVVALPSMLISRREVGEICSSVCSCC